MKTKKIELLNGVRITPSNWGEPYLIIDEKKFCEMMVGSDFENADGSKMSAIDFSDGLDACDEKNTHTIYRIGKKYWAYQEPHLINKTLMKIECDNPAECTDGALAMRGKWQNI